jgi:hypothetical protein
VEGGVCNDDDEREMPGRLWSVTEAVISVMLASEYVLLLPARSPFVNLQLW